MTVPVEKPVSRLSTAFEPLLHRHGGPDRLLVPGYFAMASVKWLESVTFSAQPSQGYYQALDYHFVQPGKANRPVTWMLAKSILTSPATLTTLTSPLVVAGKAWGGRGSVLGVRIEVQGNGVRRSVEAGLGEDLGRWAWRPFEASLELAPGDYAIRSFCRLEGEEQPLHAPWNQQGYENNSAHCVHITVE